MDKKVIDHIKEELKAAGIKSSTLQNLESKQLASILYEGETIGGAVHGTYTSGLAWLIATDKRIIFMDKKPFFSSVDEISYDVVAGTKTTASTLSDSVTLHTRMGDYTVNYVRAESAHKFVNYIEKMRLGNEQVEKKENTKEEIIEKEEAELPGEFISKHAINFLRGHDLGVLSTQDRTGNIHGAVVNYLIDQNNVIYILTKSGTSKGRNIFSSSKVALTVFEAEKYQTVQLRGDAEVETNQKNKDGVHAKLTKPRIIDGKSVSPPVTKLKEGEFMIIKIHPTEIKYHDYN